jgi:hypothetical protein
MGLEPPRQEEQQQEEQQQQEQQQQQVTLAMCIPVCVCLCLSMCLYSPAAAAFGERFFEGLGVLVLLARHGAGTTRT